jgi:hypothetical protein
MDFVASQHLDSVRDKFHMHDFIHIGEKLLKMEKQPSGALSNLLLKPADISELIEDLPDVIPRAKDKTATRRMQIKSSTNDEEFFGSQQDEIGDGNQDVIQPNIIPLALRTIAVLR